MEWIILSNSNEDIDIRISTPKSDHLIIETENEGDFLNALEKVSGRIQPPSEASSKRKD